MTLNTLFFLFLFSISSVSAAGITAINGFPADMEAGSSFNISYQVCLRQAQNYQIALNITGNSTNITGGEFVFSGCDWDSNYSVYACNRSGIVGAQDVGINASIDQYIEPDQFSISTMLLLSVDEAAGCPSAPSAPYSRSGSSGSYYGSFRPPIPSVKKAVNNTTIIVPIVPTPPTAQNKTIPKAVPPKPTLNDTAQNESWWPSVVHQIVQIFPPELITPKEGDTPNGGMSLEIIIAGALLAVGALTFLAYMIFIRRP